MPLIKVKDKDEKEQLRINVKKNVLEEVRRYCDWLGIKPDEFIEQAAELILTKDKDWKKHNLDANALESI